MNIHWKNIPRDKTRVCKYWWHPMPCHGSQDVSRAVVQCSWTSVSLLIGFFFYHKHHTEQCVFVYFSSEGPCFAARQNVCFPEKSSCKGSCCFFITSRSIGIPICAQFVSVSSIFWITTQFFMFNSHANVGKLKYGDYFISVHNTQF